MEPNQDEQVTARTPRELKIEVDNGALFDPAMFGPGKNHIRIDTTLYDVIARDGNTLTVREVIVEPSPRQHIDVAEWAKALEPNETPMLNYLQKMEYPFRFPDHSPAIIGHTTPAHPVLARLLVRPVRFIYRASEVALHLAGYAEVTDEDIYDDCDCEVKSSGGGLAGLAKRLGTMRVAWSKTEPIYDPEKIKEIDAAFAKAHPRKPMMWGMSEATRAAALDLERSTLFGEPYEPDDES